MYYLIYKTTNTINGKYYVGKHKTKNRDDEYLGSGKLLRSAIKKYGRENFIREIILECSSEEEMNLAEKILVVPDREVNYNLCPGGKGGWGYLNEEYWTHDLRAEHNKLVSGFRRNTENEEFFRALSQKGGLVTKERQSGVFSETFISSDRSRKLEFRHDDATKRRISDRMRKAQTGKLNSQHGKPRSEETKKKISETLKRKQLTPKVI